MKKDKTPTQETFDLLLHWLDPEREKAGARYEHIRRSLIRIFVCRRCPSPEDLADETINRVANKVSQLVSAYVGDPALYFYGVANRVHLDAISKRPMPLFVPQLEAEDSVEAASKCLDLCLRALKPADRELIQEYYRLEKRARIDHRKAMARRLNIPLNALRIRAYRIRAGLQECVSACLRERPKP